MTPYTIPVDEAQTQLKQLIERTKTTHRPLILTNEGSLEPMAVVIEMDTYTKTQRREQWFYYILLTQLKESLDKVERHWEDCVAREGFVISWQNTILPLWDIAPQTARGLCAALLLSVKYLIPDKLSAAQIAALRYCLQLLHDAKPDDQAQDKAHQLLFESGIPPLLSFEDDTLAQMYIDEL